jgi:phosphotransferase system enzyme I (PtsP)
MNTENNEALGLRTVEDISELILHSHDLQETLQNIVNMVARRMGSDVCSIYLLEKDGETLALYATRGLSRASVGRVRMNTSEGLTGLVVEQRGVVAIDDAPSHPRYKYFRETKEERFHSFLGLPLFEHRSPAGVIVVQTREPRTFTQLEVSTLTTIANQISSIIINARLLDSIRNKEQERAFFEQELQKLKDGAPGGTGEGTLHAPPQTAHRMIRGIPVSPGFSWGKAAVVSTSAGLRNQPALGPGTVADEKKRFLVAVQKARIQTLYLEKRVAETLSADDAAIFHTHLMILEDRAFTAKILERIEHECGAVCAVEDVVESYVAAFSRMEDAYLRERSADMKDIGRRLVDCLTGNTRGPAAIRGKKILVAKELYPSELAGLDHGKLLGIVTASGDFGSHTAIIARSLGIPAVVASWDEMKSITGRDEIIIDGNTGCIFVSPDRKVKEEYERLSNDYSNKRRELDGLRELPAVTTDGVRIHLRSNVALLNDIKVAIANGAEGVGLYRSEFPYMSRTTFPTRHELSRLYRKLLEGFAPLPVTIRTLDIGGDKTLSYFPHPREENPFMGLRSIRLSMARPEILREQLAGALMASPHGAMRLMFPLVSSVEEVIAIRNLVDDLRVELRQEGRSIADRIPLGIMIEVPASVQAAAFLVREADFFSIGTNDLIQYMLAADRNNPRIRQYYDPLHPAIIHAIKRVADVAAEAGKPVSVCGEMAADPLHAVLLLGLGITEFSLSAPYIPLIKQTLRTVSRTDALQFAQRILSLESSTAIRDEMERSRTALRVPRL